ncbi:fimbrial adhesin [Buttiauxella brennerae ATCC 51605]|uniref:Fimbrial adhesin n=1 Tax=Buttiauxella brennerae ATCC 51605 TaxID=1354251 RepID=A0A1B7IQ13_9ENTR|nr:fimbrial protein [Buttiauxella brennerae]OAT31830.1 fimbrial adhesin [Buttiauxella brennerae ATCC 51605]
MKYFALIITLLFSGLAGAVCQTVDTWLSVVNAGNIIVQRDTPVGALIGTVPTQAQEVHQATCINATGPGKALAQFDYMGGVATSIPNVYNTNIPGVGMSIVGMTGGTSTMQSPPVPYQLASGSTTITDIWSGNPQVIRLYKVGNIISGNLVPGRVGHQTLLDDGGILRDIQLSGGSVTQVACSIKTPNLVFPLGDVPVSTFGNTIGFIPDVSSTQNLGLDCDAGANFNVSLNGTQNPDSSNASVLALNNQGGSDVASGVGIQLLYNDVPLILNNRIVLKSSPGGVETFPLKARFIQTQTTVTAGDASTSATLQLTYQ